MIITELRGPVAPVVVMMGVAGTGKSAVGSALAEQQAGRFSTLMISIPKPILENARVPLTDADRWPWLEDLSCAERPPG